MGYIGFIILLLLLPLSLLSVKRFTGFDTWDRIQKVTIFCSC
jgi:DMSO/TMAO reductase YedYZ heme-binding membrane subunit